MAKRKFVVEWENKNNPITNRQGFKAASAPTDKRYIRDAMETRHEIDSNARFNSGEGKKNDHERADLDATDLKP